MDLCYMRASKVIVIICIAFWVGAIFSRMGIQYSAARENDLGYQKKLIFSDAIQKDGRIFIYGSSPVVKGLVANEIKRMTSLPTMNFARRGGRIGFDEYLTLMLEHVHQGDVVILSDPRWVDVVPPSTFGFFDLEKSKSVFWEGFMLFPQFGYVIDYVRGNWRLENSQTGVGSKEQVVKKTEAERLVLNAWFVKGKPEGKRLVPGFSNLSVPVVVRQVREIEARGACPVLLLPMLLVDRNSISKWQNEFDMLLENLKKSGIHDQVVQTTFLETDSRLFAGDTHHLSDLGGQKWTMGLIHQLSKTSRCGLAISQAVSPFF
ncbi:MAG: hypothetical protein WCK07_16750 [Betaproteobacteria bacterium]